MLWWDSGVVIWTGFAVFAAVKGKWVVTVVLAALALGFLLGGWQVRRKKRDIGR